MVLGIEADYYKSQLTASNAGFGSGQTEDRLSGTITSYESWTASSTSRLKITDYGSVRARLGYAWGNLLPYLTAGVAVARVGYTDSATVNGILTQIDTSTAPATRTNTPINFNPNSFTVRIGTSLKVGYALGAGIDWALTPNVFLRGELQHLRFASIGGFDVSINSAKVGAGLKF
jgi:opacity protein-like surface antigen